MSQENELVRTAIDDNGTATLTMMRAEKHNALSPDLMTQLETAANQVSTDKRVRVVVLGAAGKTFCAGGDLNWMRAQMDSDRATRIAEARRLANMLAAINAIDKPTIARVHANAFGGGLGIMAVCDHVVAVETAQFGFTETRLGIIPATIGPYVVARMGEGMTRRVFMSGRVFDAKEAERLGLIDCVVEQQTLDAAVAEIAKPYLDSSPDAIALAKRLAIHLGGGVTKAAVDHSIEQLADAWELPDAQARISAFLSARTKSK